MNRSIFVFAALSIAMWACTDAPTEDGVNSDDVVGEEAEDRVVDDNTASDPAPERDPNDPFYAKHPRHGAYRLSNGQIQQVPWRAQDIDYWAVYATADAKAMESLLKGSGYKPYTTTIDGERRGVVRLHSLNYRDSDDGPYKAFLLTLDVYKDDGGAERTFSWGSEYSVLLPVLQGSLLYLHRGIVTGNHETTGRELLGYDKRKGTVLIRSEGKMSGDQQRQTQVADENGEAVLYARMQHDGSPASQMGEGTAIVAGVGPEAAAAFASPPDETPQNGLGPDPIRPGKWKTYNGFGTWHPTISRWGTDDVLEFSGASELGRVARRLAIKPQIVMHDNHAQMSLDPDLTGDPNVLPLSAAR